MRRVLLLSGLVLLTVVTLLVIARQETPLPQWIIFERDNRLHRISWDGEIVEVLPQQDLTLLSTSPDGQWILWNSFFQNSIYLTHIERNETRIISTGYNIMPVWSPDSKYIAAVDDRRLGLYDPGRHVWRYLDVPVVFESSVRWSPDSEWLVFNGDVNRISSLFRVHPDGTELFEYDVREVDVRGWTVEFEWSPDGQWIAVSRGKTGSNAELYVMRADGSDIRQLTRTNDVDETLVGWSGDSQWLIYMVDSGEVYQMRTDGGDPRFITELALFFPPFTMSANGEWIVYPGVGNSSLTHIFRHNLNTGQQIELTHGAYNDLAPAFVPPANLTWYSARLFAAGIILLITAIATRLLRRTTRT